MCVPEEGRGGRVWGASARAVGIQRAAGSKVCGLAGPGALGSRRYLS